METPDYAFSGNRDGRARFHPVVSLGRQPKEPLDVVDHGLDCDCGVTVSIRIFPLQALTWRGFCIDPRRVVFLRRWMWTLVSSLVRLWFNIKIYSWTDNNFGPAGAMGALIISVQYALFA